MKRTVFLLSDRTGITVETLSHSLLTQFDEPEFEQVIIPFVDSTAKAERVVERINASARNNGQPPIVFSTLVEEHVRSIIETSEGLVLDFFDAFIGPLEEALGVKSSHTVGRSHGMGDGIGYQRWIEAVNFALNQDDGLQPDKLHKADIILVGVSRSGKTPTSLYLAMQYGIRAANYPLTEDDFDTPGLPKVLQPYKSRLFGLTIQAERLSEIRQERRPDSRYASIEQCRFEIQYVERLFQKEKIPFLNATAMSIEELAAGILLETGMKRRASLT